MAKGFWTKKRKGVGREIYLYTGIVGLAIIALVKAGWVVAVGFVCIIGFGVALAFLLRSRQDDL